MSNNKTSCTVVSEEDFVEAQENYLGWCSICKDFSREECEPDAREYDCPTCDNNTVYGADEALLMGLICFQMLYVVAGTYQRYVGILKRFGLDPSKTKYANGLHMLTDANEKDSYFVYGLVTDRKDYQEIMDRIKAAGLKLIEVKEVVKDEEI